jgi:hypothetical protein
MISACLFNSNSLEILIESTIWFAIRISLIPADTITSASLSFAQMIPIAPLSIAALAISGIFYSLDMRAPVYSCLFKIFCEAGNIPFHNIQICP